MVEATYQKPDKLVQRIAARRAADELARAGIQPPTDPMDAAANVNPVASAAIKTKPSNAIYSGANPIQKAVVSPVSMRRAPTMPKLHQRILERLAEVQYATNAQLAYWCGVQAPAISKAIHKLLAENLVDGSLLTRPMILHLTHAGGKMLNEPLPYGRQHASWSVMAHACHLNAVQELMLKSHAGFRFLPRVPLLKQGFNPAFGEHGGIDDAGTAWFVLLDDYMMASERITRSWTRRHSPNQKYWTDPTGRAWCDVAQRFLVVCTDEQHVIRHRKWLLKNNLPADVIKIQPLWKS